MKAIRVCLIIGCLSLLMISCRVSDDLGNSGYITMMPYVNEGKGIRSVVPLNWTENDDAEFVRGESEFDATTLILEKIPDMTLEEAKVFAASQLGLEDLPSILGTYTSPALTWDLYEFEAMVGGAINLQFKLAMASYEADVFVVLLAGFEEDFVNEAPLHETIYIHVIHGFSPIEPKLAGDTGP